MPSPISSRAAVRRCYRALASATAAVAIAIAAFATAAPSLQAVPASALIVAALPVPKPLTLAAAPVAIEIPDILPVPKPKGLMAAISTAAMPVSASELTCLAEAVYYEARGEPTEGQRAVAEVVARRSHTADFPKTICGVVYQDAEVRDGCQFSFACDGIAHGRRDPIAWKRSVAVAEYELGADGRNEDLTGGATYFHAVGVNAGFGRRLVRTVQIGNHIFYRDRLTQVADATT